MRRIFYGGIIAIPLLLNRVGFGQVLYSITDLGTLGGSTSVATDINNSGQVVGQATTSSGRSDAFFWDDGTMEDLGVIGTDGQSEAFGINNLGQVVGVSGPGDQTGGHAFLWQNGTMTNLGTFDDGYSDQASAINDNGKITGLNWTPTVEYYEGFSWQNGSFTALPSVTPWTTAGQSINASGNIAGFSNSTSQYRLPVAWLNGGTSLVQLPIEPASNGVANGINDSDQIVGSQYVGSYSSIVSDAMLWQNGNATVLGSLGGTNSSASAINDAGSVVGYSYTAGDAAEHAFLYTQSSGMTDLNNLISSSSGWTLSNAAAINNAGQIAATGINSAGQTHAVLLTPYLVTTPTKAPAPSQFTTPPPAPTVLGSLEVYDPKTGQFDDPASTSSSNPGYINPNEPTIVMTHGWNEDPGTWAAGMATLMNSAIQNHSGGAGTPVNLVAWDWSPYADTGGSYFPDLGLALKAVPNEGNALAGQLAGFLGTNYQLPMHYLGHSLGTMVNAGAIDEFYALDHGETEVQDTLFDAAALGNVFGVATDLAILTPPTWAPAIPTAPVMSIDNYVSAVGLLYPNAINVVLTQGPTALNPVHFHSYPMQWYDNTIGSQAEQSVMGFRYDITQPNGLIGQPVAGVDPYNFVQTSGNSGLQLQAILPSGNKSSFEVANEEYGNPVARLGGAVGIAGLNNLGALLVSEITGAIQASANAVANIFTIPADSIDNSSTPELSAQVIITKQIGAISDSVNVARVAPSLTAGASDAAPSTSSGYIWIPVVIPANASTMSFDFTFDDLSPNDFLSVGVNASLVFEIENQFLTNDAAYNSGPLDVSQWAGQNVTLFFGLNAADDNNAGGTITIDNIEYQSVPEPSATASALFLSCLLLSRRVTSVESSKI